MIKGMDLSHWDGTVVWTDVPNEYMFCFMKLTEGGWPNDELAWQHFVGAGQEAILRGGYHFWRYAINPTLQAAEFVSRAHTLEATSYGTFELGLVMDAEDTRAPTGVGHYLAKHMDQCLKAIDQQYGRTTMMYTAKWWWDKWMKDWKIKWRAVWPNEPLPDFSKRILWVADYTATPPAQPNYMPMDWTSWLFWQYSDWAEIPGIAENDEDVDVFNGTYDQLLAFAGGSAPPAPALPYTATVTASTLNVREGANICYPKYGPLSSGTKITVYEIKDGWGRISENPTHKWVSLTYTKKV